jgi:hypothetical protein
MVFVIGLFSVAAAEAALTLVSANRNRTSGGNGNSTNASVSTDGMTIAFQSTASDLVSNDNNLSTDVFAYDARSGSTRLVSIDSTGTKSAAGTSRDPIVSADGRFVAFTSDAGDVVSTPVSRNGDVYLRDLQTSTTALVSVNRGGDRGGNGASNVLGMSSDGMTILFLSEATDLVSLSDSNDQKDIFARDMRTGVTQLVSINRYGDGTPSSDSFHGTISANGRYVAFANIANNVLPNDSNTSSDIFLRDLAAGRTILVSANPASQPSNRGAFRPSLSADGSMIAFDSISSDLTANDANGNDSDIFLRNVSTNTTTLVSLNLNGTTTSGDSFSPQISANGQFVTFVSPVANLVANDTNGVTDAFVRDLQAGRTILLNTSSTGQPGNGGSTDPRISANGRLAVFLSLATNFGYSDTNGQLDVFLKDIVSGALTLVSATPTGVAGNAAAARPRISEDGRVVVFESAASNLVPGDSNARTDIFASIPPPPPRRRAAGR